MEFDFHSVLGYMLVFLSVCICISFVRAIIGLRFTDRIVAINLIGTMITAIICILAVYLDIPYLVDVALVYTLLSFLSVAVMCRVVTLHHKGRELSIVREKEQEKEQENQREKEVSGKE